MKRNNKKKGFTLVELLVVIAILAILASVTVVGYMGFTQKAKESVAKQEAEQVETVLMGSLIEGKVVQETYTFTFDGETITISKTTPAGNIADVELAAIKTAFRSLLDGNGINTAKVDITLSEEAETRTIDTIVLTASNGIQVNVLPFSGEHDIA